MNFLADENVDGPGGHLDIAKARRPIQEQKRVNVDFRLGTCSEENPDLTPSLITEILVGLEELGQGKKTEYTFGRRS